MTTHFVLGKHFRAFADAQVKTGRYADVSHVIRAGLQLLEEWEKSHVERLADLRKGVDGEAVSPVEGLFARIAARDRKKRRVR